LTVNLPSDAVLLAGAALLVAGVLCAGFADRLRAPGLLLFLGLGMALGSDGLGLIDFSDAGQAQSIGVAALVVILYEGGLSTSPRELRRVAGPGLALATLGVFVTAVVVALGALVVLDVPVTTALLLGAVVSSTDAAAVFSVLRQAPLPSRLKVLLEAESGGNDPMAVLLTVGFIQVAAGDVTAGDWLVFGVRQLAGGLLVGAAVGWIGSTALARLRFSSPALYPVLGLGVAGLAYGCAALLGTSGFLAAYVAGVVVGARAPRRRRAVRTFHEGLASTSQIALFLLLGLLVFPSRLPGVALPALAVAATLVFVARPLAVAVSLPWFGFSRRELGFASWAGLRGAVPIVLATFPLTAGHPDGQVIFDVTFFVVLVSAAVQGLTVAPLARRLGLESTTSGWAGLAEVVPLDAVGIDVVEIDVPTGSRVVGQPLREVPLPLDARVAAIVRRGEVVVPNGDSHLEEGDLLVVFARRRGELAGAITAWASG
jgi:cell volume regulation protein A